jgi:hypothetical protein
VRLEGLVVERIVFRVEKEAGRDEISANARSLSSSVRLRLEIVLAAQMRAFIWGSRGSVLESMLQKASSIR